MTPPAVPIGHNPEDLVHIADHVREILADLLVTDDRAGLVVTEEGAGSALVRYRGPDGVVVGQQRLQRCASRLRRDGYRVEPEGFARWVPNRSPGVRSGGRDSPRTRRIPPSDPRLRVTTTT